MTTQSASANSLVIEGRVVRVPETRSSPAGIPISRFTLEHQSRITEAGMSREVRLRLGVVATGQMLQAVVAALQPDMLVRVEGFLARAGYRSAEHRLVLHAQTIERLNDTAR